MNVLFNDMQLYSNAFITGQITYNIIDNIFKLHLR